MVLQFRFLNGSKTTIAKTKIGEKARWVSFINKNKERDAGEN